MKEKWGRHIFERLFTVFIHIRFAYTVNFVERPDTVMQNMIEVSPTVGNAVEAALWPGELTAVAGERRGGKRGGPWRPVRFPIRACFSTGTVLPSMEIQRGWGSP
jgi:hypothetical protein